jgi:two-component system cell cycle response regulator
MFRVPRVLIVDDEKDEVDILVEAVQDEGYRTAAAYNGEEALAIARQGDVDLVLLDVVMPKKNGYAVCKELKSDDRTRDISVIFVTVKGAVEDVSGGLDLGAHDYVTKPYDIPIVMARVRAALRAKSLQDRLQQENVELRDLTYTDELTGVRNFRYFHERLNEEVARAARYGFPLSCLVIEVDGYEELNQEFGRAPEQDIIAEVGMVLKTNSRSFDIVSREEGGRFWALLPHTSLDDALAYAENVRSQVAETLFFYPSAPSKVTISIGVCSSGAGEADEEQLLNGATDALDEARRTSDKRIGGHQLSSARRG